MSRYFIELSYKGTDYSGFQAQQNANSVQAEVEKALKIFFKTDCQLTGSSRTDAGVHALQNFFHFDTDTISDDFDLDKAIYNLNSILPLDIVIKQVKQVPDDAHCRFDAVSREYKYFIYSQKNPFIQDTAYYYPYTVDLQLLQQAASSLLEYTDFTSFSKRNTQVKTFNCQIIQSNWTIENDTLVYTVKANRFLRGMVKGLVGTMLKVGAGKISISQFRQIIEGLDCSKADFSVPAHGLFLIKVQYK